MLPLQIVSPSETDCDLAIANVVAVEKDTYQPGESFQAIWGTGYDKARALIEIEHRGKLLQRYWTPAGQTQVKVTQQIDESMRGGFVFRTTMVRENRLEITERTIAVPWTTQQLEIRWERFVSKLKPGGTETWTAIIYPGGDPEAAIKRPLRWSQRSMMHR